MRVFSKVTFFVLLGLDIFIFSAIFYLGNSLGEKYKVKKGDVLSFNTPIPITAEYKGARLSESGVSNEIGEEFKVGLKAFGVIPFSTVSVEVVDEMYVAVLGTPFGMKLYTDGVLVIDVTEVQTENGVVSPAEKAGIKKGDYILSADGRAVHTNEELSAVVSESGGEKIKFVIKRAGKKKALLCNPVKSSETGDFKIGLWVRDSSAGIGTLTFYSPMTGVVCGLGHGVCDEDTGELLSLDTGEIVKAEIVSVEKGASGSPGQLKGKFTYTALGAIDKNSENGVYSLLKGKISLSDLTEIALKNEVKDGAAQMLCTIDGGTPKLYDCKIKKRGSAYMASTQNLTVTVTDKELLEKTGGIVQGMSGSPLLQNGKLVGAVTHVLIDDPTTGYGIFAENMLKTAESVTDNAELKKAS